MKTVIMLGKRTSSVSPRQGWPDAELWGVTQSNQMNEKKFGPITDWTQWWNLHPLHPTPFFPSIEQRHPKTWAWYASLPANDRPVVMQDVDPRIPASVRFPLERVRAAFPIFDDAQQTEARIMATCQVDLMMAFALLDGYQHIILDGHGVSTKPEHMVAHRGIQYWVGFARGAGVQVTVREPSWYRAPEKVYAYEVAGYQIPGAMTAYDKMRRDARRRR